MALTNFQFPGVELQQVFVDTSATGTAELGVAIVGPHYKLVKADVNDADKVYEDLVYTSGTSSTISLAAFPGYEETIAFDPEATVDTAFGVKLMVKDGKFLNVDTADESSISVTAASSPYTTSGGVTTASVQLTKHVAGTDIPAAFGGRAVQIGDPVVIIGADTSSAAGIVTSITSGATYDTVGVEVTEEEPTLTGGTVSSIQFMVIEDAELTAGVSYSNEKLTISGTTAQTTIGNKTGKYLQSGTYDVSITYRMKLQAFVNTLGSVGSKDEIKALFGDIAVANPMALALQFALLADPNDIVYFIATSAQSATAYSDALDVLDNYSSVYSIVPMLTGTEATDVAIIQTCLEKVKAISDDTESKIWRTLWYGLPQYSDLEGADQLSKALNLIAAREARTTDKRAQAVWAYNALYNGEVVPNYILAAAPAAMRAYEPSYRPISNLGYSFLSVSGTLGAGILKRLGANGIWLIGPNFEGTPVNLRQLTTAVANNLNLDEESIIANADSIAIKLCHVGENMVGCSNISPALLVVLQDTITGIMDKYLINYTGSAYIGPQLLSWTLEKLYQDPVQLDHIYAVVSCEPPKPFNRFTMTLLVL